MPPGSDYLYRFDRAIVRQPGRSVTGGLRGRDCGAPDYAAMVIEHDAYVAALTAAGVEVTVLPALEPYPDAVFVEDPALVFSAGAIALRNAAETRRGETQHLLPALRDNFDRVLQLPPPGFVDGGDVLVTTHGAMIGLSARTDQRGAEDLARCLQQFDLPARTVATPPSVLHLKSDCALLDDQTLLATARLAKTGVFADFDVILTPPGEERAANALRVNDVVLVGAEFPRTVSLLDRRGFDVRALHVREIGKLDAGLSCLSLRWRHV